jgi:hypothetical protein
MTRSESTKDQLAAGAREVRWAPRVPLHKIRRLYETDALGIIDEEQIDDVGYALLARCRSVLEATDAHDAGRLRCPRLGCRSPIQRRGRPDRPEDDSELIRCGACGWATTGGAYRKTYGGGKQLLGANARPAFEVFLRDVERAARPQQKMLAIDRLIHAVHGELTQGWVGRPAAVNVLAGTIREIFTLLDDLAYGHGSSPELLEGRSAWGATRRAAADLSATWRPREKTPDEDPLTSLLASRSELIDTPQGRCRVLVTSLDAAAARTMPDLRSLANRVRAALPDSHVIVLASGPADGGPHYLAFVSPDLADRGIGADHLIRRFARAVGGGGGGSALEAFGGGGGSLLEAALDDVRQAVRHALGVEAGPDTEGALTP